MDVMSVAAMSISMHQGQLQQAVSVSLMREVMDQQTAQAAALHRACPRQCLGAGWIFWHKVTTEKLSPTLG